MTETFELEAEYLHAEIGSVAHIRVDGGRVPVLVVAVSADPDSGHVVLTASIPVLRRDFILRLEPTEIVDVELREVYPS